MSLLKAMLTNESQYARIIMERSNALRQMIDGVDRFLLNELKASVAKRTQHWKRDFSSAEAFNKSIEPNRKRLAHILGVRDARVVFGFHVEGGGHNFSRLNRPGEIGHFLRTLIHQQNEQLDVGMIGVDAVGDLLKQRRFSRHRRRDNQPTLPFSDGTEQIDDASRNLATVVLQLQMFVGMQRRQISESSPPASAVRIPAIHRVGFQ